MLGEMGQHGLPSTFNPSVPGSASLLAAARAETNTASSLPFDVTATVYRRQVVQAVGKSCKLPCPLSGHSSSSSHSICELRASLSTDCGTVSRRSKLSFQPILPAHTSHSSVQLQQGLSTPSATRQLGARSQCAAHSVGGARRGSAHQDLVMPLLQACGTRCSAGRC